MLAILKKLLRLRRPHDTKPFRPPRSELEYLFATHTGLGAIDALLKKLPWSEETKTVTAIILTYAGQRAARLRDAIALGHQRSNGKWRTSIPQRVDCNFDPIFIETAALCFWSVMDQYWDDDEMDFWIEDDSPDEPYLETLRDALDAADEIISKTSTKDLRCYLYQEVRFYNEPVDGEHRQPIEKYAASVATWVCRGADSGPGSLYRFIQGLSLMAAGEIDRIELESLCRTAHTGRVS